MNVDRHTHLDLLEAEAIAILRETASEFQKPVLMYSIGKDSQVLLHLARKAFFPLKLPFPLLHVDTTWKFREMYAFRDAVVREHGLSLLVHRNTRALEQGINPFDHSSQAYTHATKTQALLEAFYRRFGCELIQQSDGYFYLLPSGDRLGRRQLSAGEMLVGQTLALLYLDPATLQHGGIIGRESLLQRLSALLGTDVLVRTLDPRRARRGKYDERIAAEAVRTKVGDALRRLADLGFVDVLDDTRLRLRPALMRFAEPVRGLGDRSVALERLVRVGEVVLDDGEQAADEDASLDEEPTP